VQGDVCAELCLDVLVAERQHPAVGLADHEDLLGSEQVVRDHERPQRVVGDDARGVADDVRVALLEPEELGGVEARVHARDDCELAAGRQVADYERGCARS
jgi:hypothetical protein